MPRYRRAWVPGGTFFFTLVTYRRQTLFAHAAARRLLGSVLCRWVAAGAYRRDWGSGCEVSAALIKSLQRSVGEP